MLIETLSAELERNFELDGLMNLSRTALGFEPSEIGGTAAKGSFARALAKHCVDVDAVDALLDALALKQRALSEPLASLRENGIEYEKRFEGGDELSGYTIVSELGIGPWASCYRARKDGGDFRIKVLHQRIAMRRREVNRYLTAQRLAQAAEHHALPSTMFAGVLDADEPRIGTVHELVEGQPLSAVLRRHGARHFNDVLPILVSVTEALAALHTKDLVHGALHLDNILISGENDVSPSVALLDVGAHLLRPTLGLPAKAAESSWLVASAPEQLRGEAADARSDVYALGVLLYQLLSGRAPFVSSAVSDVLLGHLTGTPEPLSFVAAGKGAGPGVDAFARSLLDKQREHRPRNAAEVLEGLQKLWRASTRPPSWVADERVPEMFANLAQTPFDEESANQIEATVDLGADPVKLAEGFYDIARQVRGRPEPGADRLVRKFLARAARLYELGERHDKAEKLYAGLVKLDPADRAAAQALERLLKTLGKYEELIESLLERSEKAAEPELRAAHWFEIGELYAFELKDKEQALVAYAQAVCEDPSNDQYAEAVERLAGTRHQAWEEVLTRCIEAAGSEIAADARHELLLRMGRWYTERVARPDLALPWLNELLEEEPGHDRALMQLAQIYRKAQQWAELVQTLLRRADVVAPNLARDLRAEAAEILISKLANPGAARDILDSVLAEDAGHARGAEAMLELLRGASEHSAVVKVLQARAAALNGEPRHRMLCEAAEVHEIELDALEPAADAYRKVIAENPQHIDALRGLDRVLTRLGRYRDLVEVLRTEIDVAVTARQKISLYERLAGIYDEEFLDHTASAEALEEILKLEPERPDTVRELARHYRSLDRFQDVAELYEKQLSGAADKELRIESGLALGRVLSEQLKQAPRAISVYETVLELAPGHAGALDQLATLRAVMGDAENALFAIEALASKAGTPVQKAEQYLRAANLLEARGDIEGAILRYKLAADVNPDDPAARRRLRQKYVEVRNFAAAVELLEDEMSDASGNVERAKVAGDIALLCFKHLRDEDRALSKAQLALHLDPTNSNGLRVLGHAAYKAERYVEAAKRLEMVVSEIDGSDPVDAAELAVTYIDALVKSGANDKAIAAAGELIKWLEADVNSLLRIAAISAEHGSPEQTLWVSDKLLGPLRDQLLSKQQSEAELHRGQALSALGRHDEAIAALERAADLDAGPDPLQALAKANEKAGDYRGVLQYLYQEYDISVGERRVELLIEMGDVAAAKLGDPDYAAKSYLLALSERQNDRAILAKLMQLYGKEKNFPQLIQVITKLAQVVEEPKHKAKYLHTASMIASRELGDLKQAGALLDEALEHDAELEPALDEALSLRERARDYEGMKKVLKLRAAQATRKGDQPRLTATLEKLAEVYERHLNRRDQATAVYESLEEVDPENPRWQEKLAQLYAADPVASFEKAVEKLGAWIQREPYAPAPYKALRKLYTEARYADPAWCVCQTLHVLGQAEPDETRFFERMRNEELAFAQQGLTQQEWSEYLLPEDTEPFVTALFALIQPYLIAARAKPAESFGLTPEHVIDAEQYPYGLVLALHQGANALGIDEPVMFQVQHEPHVISFVQTKPPSISLGARAFDAELSHLAAAFMAGRHLAYLMPGFYARQLLTNTTALKSWFFAAIRLVKPKFPVASELEPAVAQAVQALSASTAGGGREQLTHIVSKLLRDGAALDLKRWAQMVDVTADRAGLALCHDLETAVSLIRRGPQDPSGVPIETRLEQLMAYSVSAQYLTLRERLGVTLDA